MDYHLAQDVDAKLGGEIGTIYKIAGEYSNIVLVYPNTYYVGMSNLGFQTMYGFLNERADVRCERAFLPDPEVIARYEHTKTPVFSFESKTPLTEFDIIAFSVSFENDYLNILKILELSGVPLKAKEREGSAPLIILGGTVTTINPEPLAMFIDLFVIGDGEMFFEKFIALYKQHANTCSKPSLLERMAEIPGTYVPSLYAVEYDNFGHIKRFAPTYRAPESIARCVISNLTDYPAYSRILTDRTEFGDMFLIQINRGCCYTCRFCHTGYAQRPLRHLSLDVALQLIREGLHYRNKIGLVGSAIAEYPELQELCSAIVAQGGEIAVSSLRMNALARSNTLLEVLLRGGQKTMTIAPEAGTERLRKIIQKALPDSVLYDALEHLVGKHRLNLKLYFLIGLPTETADDIEAIIEMCKKCRHIMLKAAKSQGTIGKITVSVNPFVPKPFTPLQWCAMDSEAELKQKLFYIKRGVGRLGNTEVIHEVPKWAVWQGILARGDRKLGQVLLLTLHYQGDWKKAFRELNMHPGFYAQRTRSEDEFLPWNYLNVGVSHQALIEEYHNVGVKSAQ